MPSKTFFNLPKDKKIRILKAGKKEFSRVPLDKAIIANIAKDADIPRGSFYQYFNSLEDLFTYILEYMYGFNKKKFETKLMEHNSNIYETLKDHFACEIDRLSKEDNKQFKINTLSILFKENDYSSDFINKVITRDTNIDLDFFPENYQNNENFVKVVDLIKIVSDNCVQKYLSNECTSEEIKQDYNEYIDFVKMGFGNL